MAIPQSPEDVPPRKRPVSAQKAEANRLNAQKSTGPRTPRGKAFSRRNSLKHGLFSKDIPNFSFQREEAEDFWRFLEDLSQQYEPVGIAEELEVQRIAVCWWRLKRAWRYENAQIITAQGEIAVRASTSKMQEEAMSDFRPLVLLFENAEIEVKASGKISAELQEKIFAADPSIRVLWTQFEQTAEQAEEDFLFRIALQVEKTLPELREFLQANPSLGAEYARFIPRFIAKLAKAYVEKRVQQNLDSCLNVLYDHEAVPNVEVQERILRYESAAERDRGRAIDRLERLQRRRQGELVSPPVSVSLT